MPSKRRTKPSRPKAKAKTKKPRKKLFLTAVLEKENKGYLSLCPEFDITSKGKTPNQALENLKQSVKHFLNNAPARQIKACIHNQILITRFETSYGT